MKRCLLRLILMFSLSLSGCMQNAPSPATTLSPTPQGAYAHQKSGDNNASKVLNEAIAQNSQALCDRSGQREITIHTFPQGALYLPQKSTHETKLPLVLFAPGWGSQNHTDYKTLLSFIAAQGYAVIYAKSPSEYGVRKSIHYFETILHHPDFSDRFDRSRLGVVGHSSGGGIAFALLLHFTEEGYGAQGKFLFAIDPWFAFGMSERRFAQFPADTNVIIQQYGDSGSTDPRIALTIFRHISRSVKKERRDYQYYPGYNHAYPLGESCEKMPLLLKPLDALMQYTFLKLQSAAYSALEIGSDTPYEAGIQTIYPTTDYDYRCDANHNPVLLDALNGLDYCAVVP